MKRNWRYGRQLISRIRLLSICILLLVNLSCNRDEHKHITTSKTIDLSGLEQPTNQVVFSDLKTISLVQKTITLVITATGLITYDPRLMNTISARFSGRIEKLYVRFNFENVVKGQRIMDIYSSEIVTAQEDFIFLLNNSSSDISLVNSSKQKLHFLGLSDEQIKQIETSKKPINPLPIYSSYTGHIHDIGSGSNGVNSSMNSGGSSDMNTTSKSNTQEQIKDIPSSQNSALTIKEGMYVQSGQAIFAVYNTSRVWAVLNIYPKDAAMIKLGDKVTLNVETNSTNSIQASINVIEPVSGQNTSSIKARVYIQSIEAHHLKIGTLVTAKIASKEITGQWLPKSSVVSLGQNKVVFLKTNNHFISKAIHAGMTTDSLVQIIDGLQFNDQVSLNAQFLVDSESFIQTDTNEQK